MSSPKVDVITLDGPSGTGKGTLATLLAKRLGWHVLDSGAIYRALAFVVMQQSLDLDDTAALTHLLSTTQIDLLPRGVDKPVKVLCNQHDITHAIREEAVGLMAAKVGAIALVREAVLPYQRKFQLPPGLVADGRDMGTVVFPDAVCKFYLDAAPAVRVQRRYQQLQASGNDVSLRDVESALAFRDQQDTQRALAPLEPAKNAQIIDTSDLSVDQVFEKVMVFVRAVI